MDAAAFTLDGSQLVTTLFGRPYLRVWDLRAIRRRLAELDLDWDPPAIVHTAATPGSFPPIAKPFHVDHGQLDSWLNPVAETPEQLVARTSRAIAAKPDDIPSHLARALALVRLGRHEEAIANFSRVLKDQPVDVRHLESRGWSLAALGQL